jgi:hypothetical protein
LKFEGVHGRPLPYRHAQTLLTLCATWEFRRPEKKTGQEDCKNKTQTAVSMMTVALIVTALRLVALSVVTHNVGTDSKLS